MSKKATILYVDDEPTNLQLFELNFNNKYNVITAESGLYGIEQLNKYPEIKIVISDMRMPEMNGIEFIKQAKKDFPNIAYFILTGFEISVEITEALQQKIIDKYLKKPFNKFEIESTIEEFLHK